MIIAVTGGRAYEIRKAVYKALDDHAPTRVFVGDCPRGVDYFVACWCRDKGVPVSVFAADWEKYGKSAGPIRNNTMLDAFLKEGGERLLAFPGGAGTLNCKRLARTKNLEVLELGAWAEEYCGEEHA